MRFTPHGPSIPDELLFARDRGEVVFFCGAGVSLARAGLSNFTQLARKVLQNLGASSSSPARKLLEAAAKLDPIEGVGTFVATDRVFSLLEREFETKDIHAAVATALMPSAQADLSAHRIILDLAGAKSGGVRLVTTNFDLLFEACDKNIRSVGPLNLPDPKRADLNGIVHLHGRVDQTYLGSDNEGFVLSSGDFGRAYLAEGWATTFIQSLLAKFSIVFIGYSADDPPVQYLLEALKGTAGSTGKMYAFQSGASAAAASLWENKGVHAIAYSDADGHEALWSTLSKWSHRAADVDGWYETVLTNAESGPQSLAPFERGQIAHILSSAEGARRLSNTVGALPSSWIRVIDPRERYGEAHTDPSKGRIDPFDEYGLDSDTPPPPPNPSEDELAYLARPREVPEGSWNGFNVYPVDEDGAEERASIFYGRAASSPEALPERIQLLGSWFVQTAGQNEAFDWALKQTDLHPAIKSHLQSSLEHHATRFSSEIAKGWRFLLRAWDDKRPDANQTAFSISAQTHASGWSDDLVRRLIDTRRAILKVEPPFRGHEDRDARTFTLGVEYPRPHIDIEIPAEMLAIATARCRDNLEYARSLEREVRGSDWISLPTTYEAADARLNMQEQYGLAGPVLELQRLTGQLAIHDPAAARFEFSCWRKDDDGIFARLRIWASGNDTITAGGEAAAVISSLSDTAFWSDLHQRDLLLTLRARWNSFPADGRAEIERKLLETSYPWPNEELADEHSAYYRLERLRWFMAEGLPLSFDVDAMVEALSARVGRDLPPADVAVEDNQPKVFSIGTDTDPTPLLLLPIREILATALAQPETDYRSRVYRDPFAGLIESLPVRAFSALSHLARDGIVHAEGWSSFLRSRRREQDSIRMMTLIAGRLGRLTPAQFSEILYAAVDWMKRLASRLRSDLPAQFDLLWWKAVEAAGTLPPAEKRNTERSWADEGLNSPIGKLGQILLEDDALRGSRGVAALSADWKRKMASLLELPGDLRRHALVLVSYRFLLFCSLDRKWAAANIMPSMDSEGPDADAFWDGFLWAKTVPCPPLFKRMRPSLLRRVREGSRRKSVRNGLADIVLFAWLAWSDRRRPPLSNEHFREAIVEGGAEFAVEVIWHLGRNLKGGNVGDQKIVEFFREVWPLQKALRVQDTSRALSSLAFDSGEHFPRVAALCSRHLVACENFDLYSVQSAGPGGILEEYPVSLLDMLARLLPQDVRQWPYYTREILDRLKADQRTASDERLLQLRRRLGLPSKIPPR
ncbi:SIR2 family protein [Rhizobium leguminosarum]|uniref:SIR2 family protein n=1 Tax=Rhizobium leguminosarum TaxID=384 RepID=UPI0013D960C3|nr:SIR2 family protein [Rhizobium leguminosarum]NEK34255.1 hypothetical protein [Rhizobium leguminosarum]